MSPQSLMRLVFSTFWVVALGYTAWASRDFSANSGVFPGVTSLLGLLLAIAVLASAVRIALGERSTTPVPGGESAEGAVSAPGPSRPDESEPEWVDAHEEPVSYLRSARYGAWMLGLVLAVWLVGAVVAAGLFVGAFLAVEARAGWKWLIAGPVLMMAGLVVLANGINLYWPTTLLGSLMGS